MAEGSTLSAALGAILSRSGPPGLEECSAKASLEV